MFACFVNNVCDNITKGLFIYRSRGVLFYCTQIIIAFPCFNFSCWLVIKHFYYLVFQSALIFNWMAMFISLFKFRLTNTVCEKCLCIESIVHLNAGRVTITKLVCGRSGAPRSNIYNSDRTFAGRWNKTAGLGINLKPNSGTGKVVSSHSVFLSLLEFSLCVHGWIVDSSFKIVASIHRVYNVTFNPFEKTKIRAYKNMRLA
jgi:hypothetical protein